MDDQIIKEITFETHAIVSKFFHCLKEAEKTDTLTSDLFRKAINEIGWISIDHNGVEECLSLMNDNYEKARNIQNEADRKTLMKCLSLIASPPMMYVYQKGFRMDKAGCGDLVSMHMLSAANICYYLQKKLVERKDVKLIYIFSERYPFLGMLPNAWTGKKEHALCGTIGLVQEDGDVHIDVWSLMSNRKEELPIHVNKDLEAVTIEENGTFSYRLRLGFFDDENFGL